MRCFFESSYQISLLSILVPYSNIAYGKISSEKVFSASIILSIFNIYGNYFFALGLKTFTQGRVVFRRIKELLMTKDLEMLEFYEES